MLIKEEIPRRKEAAGSNKKMCFLALVVFLVTWFLLARSFDIVTIDRAKGTARGSEGVAEDYSNRIAESMAQHDYFYQQASSILKLHEEYCSQEESGAGVRGGVMSARNEALCGIFTEAVEMVGAFPRRLGESSLAPQSLFRFDLLEGGGERTIGPFLSRRECSIIAARLVQLGEQVTSCLPYEEWHYELFFAEGRA